MLSETTSETQISKPDSKAGSDMFAATPTLANDLYQFNGTAVARQSQHKDQSSILPSVTLLEQASFQNNHLAEALLSQPGLLASIVNQNTGLIDNDSLSKELNILSKRDDAEGLAQQKLIEDLIQFKSQTGGGDLNPDDMCRSNGIQLSVTQKSQKNLAIYFEHDPQLVRAISDHNGILNKELLERAASSKEFQSPERQDVLKQLLCSFDVLQSRDGIISLTTIYKHGGISRQEIPASVSSVFEQLWKDPMSLKLLTNEQGLITKESLNFALNNKDDSDEAKRARTIAEVLQKNFTNLSQSSPRNEFIDPDKIARECGYHLSTTGEAQTNLWMYLKSDQKLLISLGALNSVSEDKIESALFLPENQTPEKLDVLRQLQDTFQHLANKNGVIDFNFLLTSKTEIDNKQSEDAENITQGVVTKSSDAPDYYSLQGPPTISAEKIDQILSSHKSPASGLGSQIYAAGLKYGIDPAVALAFFAHESSFGTAGIAVENKSFGNFRDGKGGFKHYPNWQSSVDDWFSTMKNLYFKSKAQGGFGTTTVADIVPIYAPASDGNAPTSYIRTVEALVKQWRTEQNSNA